MKKGPSDSTSQPPVAPHGAAKAGAPEKGPITRRVFFVTSGGLLLGMGVTACASESALTVPPPPPPPPPENGSARVRVSGLSGSPPNGGTAVLTRAGGGTQRNITLPTSGDHTENNLPEGSYSAVYTPPTGHEMAPGQNPSRTLTVQANLTTTVDYGVALQVSTGTLSVTVTGLSASAANGGSALAHRTDAAGTDQTINISAAGSGSGSLPAGTYTVTYTPPTGHTVNGTNPVTGVVVTVGASTSVGFAAAQSSVPTGTVAVTVTGLSASAPNGGSALAHRTDAAGTDQTINISAAGSGSGSLPAGTYTVTYTPPSGHTVSGTNPVTGVVVTVGASTPVGFTAAQSVPTGGLIFAAQFRTLGTGAAALTDSNRFDTSTEGVIVTAASTGISGWPVANVLRVDSAAGTHDNIRCSVNMGPLAVGATRYHRVYFASTMDAGSTDNSAHPIENQGVGVDEEYGIGTWWHDGSGNQLAPTSWNWSIFAGDDIHFREATGGGFPMPIVAIAQHVVWRIEWAIHRISATQYTVQARRYNAAGVLQADESDLFRDTGQTLGGTVFTITNANSFAWLSGGSNQGGWMPAGSSPQCYQTAFAVSDEDWLGAYNAAEANWTP
jgi:hypothetical protein